MMTQKRFMRSFIGKIYNCNAVNALMHFVRHKEVESTLCDFQ